MITVGLSTRSSDQDDGLFSRVNWNFVGLLLITYLIAGAGVWILFSTTFWSSAAQPFAELVITHSTLIRLGTLITAGLSSLFFFWPRNGGRLAGWWSGFVGLAFATFFVQSLLRIIDHSLGPGTLSVTEHRAFLITISLCSALNNLLFLAAARILLIKNRKLPPMPSAPQEGAFAKFKHSALIGFTELRMALPVWACVVALLSILGPLNGRPNLMWARFPDAIFSAYCLAWFGYAVAANLNFRVRHFLSFIALFVALVYGAGQLVLALNPIIAYTAVTHNPQTAPLPWIKKELGNPVNTLTLNVNDTLQKEFGDKAPVKDINPRNVLDGAVLAFLLPMKGALFIPAFFLYLLFINSVNDFRGALGEAIKNRQDYLSGDGIVQGIGKSLGADRVTLFIRVPGVQRRSGHEEDRVLELAWDARDPAVSKHEGAPFSIEKDPVLVSILKTKGEEEPGPPVNVGKDGAPFEWVVPIRFHDGVIGALKATLKSYHGNYTTVQKLRLLAEIVAPSVQDFRSLAAADQIGFRFTRLQVENPKEDFETITRMMVDVLHDVLAPLATRIDIEIGFKHSSHMYPANDDESNFFELPRTETNGDHVMFDNEKVLINKTTMQIWTGDGPNQGYLPVGTMWSAIFADRDKLSRPTLAAYPLTRRMAASFATDGMFDVARHFLGAIIKEVGVQFSKEGLTQEEWFAAIVDGSTTAGLLWVVATDSLTEPTRAGESPEVVSQFSDADQKELVESPLNSFGSGILPSAPAIRLRTKSKQLWFGVARAEFGPELNFESPWKAFLTELGDVANTALYSMEQRQSTEAEKVKRVQDQGVMTIAVTTGTLMHQLLNMIKSQLFVTETLEEELGERLTQMSPHSAYLLRTMKMAAWKMQELTATFKNVTKMQERRPCSLRDAVDQAAKLFEPSLLQRIITVENKVPAKAEVDVPFYVAAFALANLMGNAIDAVRVNGWIRVAAEEDETFVLCHVTNNGPAMISDEIRGKLFQFGQSFKDGHNGWGLYFVEKSLKESGGAIELAYSTSEATRFTIRLPKPKRT